VLITLKIGCLLMARMLESSSLDSSAACAHKRKKPSARAGLYMLKLKIKFDAQGGIAQFHQ
jgi:hypothetical protein